MLTKSKYKKESESAWINFDLNGRNFLAHRGIKSDKSKQDLET